MKSFDERAEATASDNQGRNRPSPGELKAVRKVLRSRNRKFEDHLTSIDTFLHLNSGDPTEGPPSPGTFGHRELVDRFESVAKEIRTIRSRLAHVDFNADDKRDLRDALGEAAQSWDARARMTRSSDPQKITAALDAARKHDKAAAEHGKSVRVYFEKDEE